MNRVSFHGQILTGDTVKLTEVFCRWLRTADLDFKLRHTGWETVYENGDFYLYCSESLTNRRPIYFLLEGCETNGKLEQMNARLVELLNLCRGESIECRLEYVEENEAGSEVSEEFTVN